MDSTKFNEDRKEVLKCNSNSEPQNSLKLTPKSIINGLIFSEILGEPKGKKGLVSYNARKSINSR